MTDTSYQNFNSKVTSNILLRNNIFDRRDPAYFKKFNRFGYIDPFTSLTSAREYLFFTRPDLNLFSEKHPEKVSGNYSETETQGSNDGMSGTVSTTSYSYNASESFELNPDLANYPFFKEMRANYLESAKQLQLSCSKGDGNFMCMLSNAVRDTLDLPDINTRQVETAATVYGTSISYESDEFSTDENHSFSLEFEDTRHLDLYMLFKCWHEYTRRKSFGEIEPVDDSYGNERILHDQISIFKFIVGENGEDIIHYSKLYGCRPQGVPRATFSDLNSNVPIKYSVSWKAEFVEDMDPMILGDFNALTKNIRTANLPLFDMENGEGNFSWASTAYIEQAENSMGKNIYKLKWRK